MIIKSLAILDFENKEANIFHFSNGDNLIISKGNTYGKSSLLKSLYYTLGFDVRQFPSGWNKNDMYFQIEVEIENTIYKISRQKDVFRVSDRNETMNVKEYSEWLNKKLNIKMELPNVYSKKYNSAYSSALILPFYIDQDDSWEGILYKRVSDTLNQYSGIPKNIFESLFNISNEEINDINNEITINKNKIKSLENNIIGFREVINSYQKEKDQKIEITKLDKDSLKKDIDNYLGILNDFNKEITIFKMELLNKQSLLDIQNQELKELEKLQSMNKDRYKNIESECSYCHSKLTKEKSLTRLNLSNNYYEISILKDTIEKDINKLKKEIKELISNRNRIDKEIDLLNERIQKSKELLTIDEYVKAAVKTEAMSEIENLINKQIINKERLDMKLKNLKKQLSDFKKKKLNLKSNLESKYKNLVIDMNSQFRKTNLDELSFLQFKKIDGSGIDKNKKYLAYYLIYFNLLRDHSIIKIPFCIDSFIKNEISGENASEMFGAIENNFFNSGNQTFFSIISENLKHFSNTGKFNFIEINEKLLNQDNFIEVSKRFDF
ncbi:hypothetical protein [Macrococcoides caseolyticum]|uniref:hypothetical protein n=1 Tax=Macrococcoides caseolyticum TaxID=69966 RepID=UPI000C327E7E|nr:hypothetical protein [Macrococcus caseolyticus]PKE48585.1 hypothetical protein CW677_02905 [Macrococcus caseolyticus]PKF15636.1 hypothetical protein CW690_02905 [Macrococcus caseolyticus]TDM25996.1 hypothetical protein ETI01_02650 [Macrococcus caseolyticus]